MRSNEKQLENIMKRYNKYMNAKNFERLNSGKRLTALEEAELSSIILSKDSSELEREKAIERLTIGNFKLVAKIACQYASKTNTDVEDLVSAGIEGLMVAVYKYDQESFGTKFSTYAVNWIVQAIKKYLYKSSAINVPSAIIDQTKKYKMLVDSGIDNDSEIIDILKISKVELRKIKMAIFSTVDLDEPVENKDGNKSTYADVIPDEKSRSASECAEEEESYELLLNAVDGLDAIQKDIVVSRYLNPDKSNLAELGKKYGMTGENVRLIEKKAFDALREKIEEPA